MILKAAQVYDMDLEERKKLLIATNMNDLVCKELILVERLRLM
jgi:hypothetical protein